MPLERFIEDQARQLEEEFEFFAKEGKWISPSAYLFEPMQSSCSLNLLLPVLHKLDGSYIKDD